ncbi:spermidine/putrescine ABC transporter substrate-binding protein [Cyanobacteria bacterium FACHB-471]|nr:spermidine/putrescine ABC transporter substrate-binding protein [Cyanobacteria bacterium FACHB-471]
MIYPKQFSSGSQRLAVTRAGRRQFLQFSAALASTVLLSNCQQNQSQDPAQSTETQSVSPPANSEPLHIYTWADYSDDEVYKRFTDNTGIEVIADVYDANETMLAKLQAGGGNQYSILYPSDYMVKQMIELKLLSEIDQTRLTGMDQLLDKWKSPPYDPNNAHSVPISWGTTGFIYNKKVLTTPPTDWNSLWEQREALAGQITLLDDVREVMGAALKSLGYSYNSTNPQEIEAAYNKLRELKPAIQSFQSFGWEDPLIAGDITLSMTYSILGNALVADNPDLDYVIPSSGTSVWTDTMVIPTSAPNVEAAYAWINFMLEPENSAFAVERLKFATPNQAVVDLLPSELTQNTELFPTSELLAKCEGIAPVDEAIEIYDRYWTQLKSV